MTHACKLFITAGRVEVKVMGNIHYAIAVLTSPCVACFTDFLRRQLQHFILSQVHPPHLPPILLLLCRPHSISIALLIVSNLLPSTPWTCKAFLCLIPHTTLTHGHQPSFILRAYQQLPWKPLEAVTWDFCCSRSEVRWKRAPHSFQSMT